MNDDKPTSLSPMVQVTEIELKMLEEAHNVVNEAIEQENPEIAFSYARRLTRQARMSSWQLGEILCGMSDAWAGFGSDDPFHVVAAQSIGLSENFVYKAMETWRLLIAHPIYVLNDGSIVEHSHPGERQQRLLGHSVDTMSRFIGPVKMGMMGEDEWGELEKCPTHGEAVEFARRLRDKDSNKTGAATRGPVALRIMLERDGAIKARRGGAYLVIGRLYLQSPDLVAQEAMERIISSSGMFRR